ncbi:MAG TPA: GNAT family N-acetyltransferase [Tepidisphaeraceae bacterium]|nr:GNAT family N-acetyltransferase [Tepidisphaeraceae bacterium]
MNQATISDSQVTTAGPSAATQTMPGTPQATGYLHPSYAASLEEFGEPRLLSRCQGWVLARRIPGHDASDAMGCYPLFCCRNWDGLEQDFAAIGSDLVSLALVTDPFGIQDIDALRSLFDRVIHFKDHQLVDLLGLPDDFGNRHHRYYARKSLKGMTVERCADPARHLDDWHALYLNLVERHSLKGMKAFSRRSFAKQLETPGLIMFRAVAQGQTVGAQLWYIQGDVAYSHLAATNEAGYALRAPYGMYWSMIDALRKDVSLGLRWLDLGAGAGMADGQADGQADGLTVFKAGWATDRRPVYFCGKIFDPDRYNQITRAANTPETKYFPAYRHGEFA